MMVRFPVRPACAGAVLAASLALSACGSGDTSATKGWKPTDACAMLDKQVVAATLGAPVTSTKLDAVKAEGDGFDLYSQCTYRLADGRMVVFGASQATNGATTADQVARIRGQLAQVVTKPVVDLPGVGKAALWSAEMQTLYAFLGDGKFASVLIANPDVRAKPVSAEKTQADDIAILRTVGA